jgi:hypothetical protein
MMISSSIFGPFSIQNISPLMRNLIVLFLLLIVLIVVILAVAARSRREFRKKIVLSKSELKNLEIGLCLGSFTDEGLRVRTKSKNCPFDDEILKSALDYSATLFQFGKTKSIYGSFPLTNLKEVDTNVEEIKWYFISFWTKKRDDAISDQRIIREGGLTSIGILLFYPSQFDSVIMSQKNDISEIYRSALEKVRETPEITSEILNKIELRIIKLFKH